MIRSRYILPLWFALLFLLCCAKEYSYEKKPVAPPDTASNQTKPDTAFLWHCPACDGSNIFEENKWSFYAENTLLCGDIDTAIVLNSRASFTFFGPSTCAADTGMIVTVYIQNTKLDHDITNLYIPKVAFYYYHTSNPYILLSKQDYEFTMTIDSYNNTTKMAQGTFKGIAFKQNYIGVPITLGKFKVKLI